MINTTSESLKQDTSLFVDILVFMSSWNLVLSWVEYVKSFITSEPWFQAVALTDYLLKKHFNAFANRADPDQAALVRAAWSGSTLFAHGNMIYLLLHKWTWQVFSLFYVPTWKFIYIIIHSGGALREHSWRKFNFWTTRPRALIFHACLPCGESINLNEYQKIWYWAIF